MKRYAIISNKDSGKNCAIIVHEPEISRVVIKCRDADWPIQNAFSYWIDETLIYQEPKDLNGTKVTVRKKAVKSDPKYLDLLLDRVVRRPYEVKSVLESMSTLRLDIFLDNKAKEVLG